VFHGSPFAMTSTFNKILVALLLSGTIGIYGYAEPQDHKDNAHADAQVSQTQHVVIDQINAKPDKDEAAKEDAKEQREDAQKKIEMALTGAIMVAACVQAIFAGFQWKIYKAQLKTSMPLVVIDWDDFIHLAPPDPDPTPGSRSMVHHFHWTMRNAGQTPAFVTEVSARFVIVPTSQDVSAMKYADPKPYTGEPLFAEPRPAEDGYMPLYTPLEDRRTYDQIEIAYRSGNEALYAFGCIKFKDRYGRRHSSKFCFRYRAWRTLRRGYDGWGIAKDKPNKYT
jgi:hypothetical protein